MNQQVAIDMLYSKYGRMYMSKDQTAHELGVGLATIDRMRQEGEIKSSKIRGSIKFSVPEVAKFIKN